MKRARNRALSMDDSSTKFLISESMFMAGVLPAEDDRGFAGPDARLHGKRLPGSDGRSSALDYGRKWPTGYQQEGQDGVSWGQVGSVINPCCGTDFRPGRSRSAWWS
jgi:hypothetical protein